MIQGLLWIISRHAAVSMKLKFRGQDEMVAVLQMIIQIDKGFLLQ